jgi:hypothetical protein
VNHSVSPPDRARNGHTDGPGCVRPRHPLRHLIRSLVPGTAVLARFLTFMIITAMRSRTRAAKFLETRAAGKQSVTDRDLQVQVLSLEYQALRAEILVLTSSRYQFLGFTTAAGAILATGAGHLFSGLGGWLLVALGGGIFVFGVAYFYYLGRGIASLSAQIADIENRINNLVPANPGDRALLSWESGHQNRSFLQRWVYGYRLSAKRATGSKVDKSLTDL